MRRAPSRRQALAAAGTLLVVAGLWQLGSALFIPAKAAVAQALLHRAWERTLAGEEQAKPWPWADTWPVARLRLPGVGADLIVLGPAVRRWPSGPVTSPAPPRPDAPVSA